jgi:hypothetical protein
LFALAEPDVINKKGEHAGIGSSRGPCPIYKSIAVVTWGTKLSYARVECIEITRAAFIE